MFETCKEAMSAIRSMKMGAQMCAVPKFPGWVIERQDREPLTLAQRERIEAHEHAPVARAPVAAKAPAKPAASAAQKREAKPATDRPAKASSERKPGAMAICREVFATINTDKAAFVAECAKRGVFEGTSKARWSDLVRK